MPHGLPGGVDPTNPATGALDPSTGPALLAQLLGSTELGQLPGLIDAGFLGQFRNPVGGQIGIGSIEDVSDVQRAIAQALQRAGLQQQLALRGVSQGGAADVTRGLLGTQQELTERGVVERRARQRLRGLGAGGGARAGRQVGGGLAFGGGQRRPGAERDLSALGDPFPFDVIGRPGGGRVFRNRLTGQIQTPEAFAAGQRQVSTGVPGPGATAAPGTQVGFGIPGETPEERAARIELGQARAPSLEESFKATQPPPQIRALQQAIQAAELQEREQQRRGQQLRAAGIGTDFPPSLGFVVPGGFGGATNNLSAFVLGNPGQLPADSPEQAFHLTLGGAGPNAERRASTLDLARATVQAWAVASTLDRERERERRTTGAVRALETGEAGFGQGVRGLGAVFGAEGLDVARRLQGGESLEDIQASGQAQLRISERAEQRMRANLEELARRQSQASRPRARNRAQLQTSIRKREDRLYERLGEQFDVLSLFNVDASRFGLSADEVLRSFINPRDAEALLSELASGVDPQTIADRVRGKQQLAAELQRRQRQQQQGFAPAGGQ